MSFETQLKETYAKAHARLLNLKPKIQEIVPPPVVATIRAPQRLKSRHPEVKVINRVFELSTGKVPNLHMLLQLVSDREGMSITKIKNARRHQSLVWPRQIFYFLARYTTNASLNQIGRCVNKDHTTVLHGIYAIERKVYEDQFWRDKIAKYMSYIERLEKVLDVPRCPHCRMPL